MTQSIPRVGSLTAQAFEKTLRGDGLPVRMGPFDALIRVRARGICAPLYSLYVDYPLLDRDRVFSFHADLEERWDLRRWSRKVRFSVDGLAPHEDMPAEHALPVLEWGINLVVAMRFQALLMLHSAVVERNGQAVLMPAAPGHGKSTLCAAMVHRGWRLLSDEFGLVRPGTTEMIPLPRPMPLKNESIDVLRRFAPNAVLGPEIPGTRKGTVAHVKPPADSVVLGDEAATPAFIVFPRWQQGARLSLVELPPSEGFMQLATHAFNYEALGQQGFETVRDLVRRCRCFQLVYSDLAEALVNLNRLVDADAK